MGILGLVGPYVQSQLGNAPSPSGILGGLGNLLGGLGGDIGSALGFGPRQSYAPPNLSGGNLVQGPPNLPSPYPAPGPNYLQQSSQPGGSNYNPFSGGFQVNGPTGAGFQVAQNPGPPTVSPLANHPAMPPPTVSPIANSPWQGMWRGGGGQGVLGQQWDIQRGNSPWQKPVSGSAFASPWSNQMVQTPTPFPGVKSG